MDRNAAIRVLRLVSPDARLLEAALADPPALRGRGIATAAAHGLVRDAFLDAAVAVVVACTDPAPNPSARVLAKAGFLLEGEFPDEEIGRVWRFRRERGQTR